jgi:hypothetical protein
VDVPLCRGSLLGGLGVSLTGCSLIGRMAPPQLTRGRDERFAFLRLQSCFAQPHIGAHLVGGPPGNWGATNDQPTLSRAEFAAGGSFHLTAALMQSVTSRRFRARSLFVISQEDQTICNPPGVSRHAKTHRELLWKAFPPTYYARPLYACRRMICVSEYTAYSIRLFFGGRRGG